MEAEKIKSNNLNNFVNIGGKNLSHTSHLIIDLTCLTDNNDEIISALNTLKRIYIDMRIIVFADSPTIFEENKDLLRRIYNKGIYNILTALTDEEIHNSIMFGKTEKQAQEILNINADKEETASRPNSSESAPPPIEVKETTKAEEKKTATLMPNKSFRKIKKHLTIAVCSAGHHAGATHGAIQITKFLNDVGFKAAYLEAQENRTIHYLKSLYPQNCNANERKNLLQCFGVPIYTGFQISEVLAQGYDFYIFDFGVLTKEILTSFLTKDIKILICGSKAWELAEIAEAIKLIGGKNEVNIFLNFVIENDKSRLLDFMDSLKRTTYFTEYSPNPFKEGANLEVYKKVFSEYVTTGEVFQQNIPKKKSFFPKIFN